MNQEKQEVRRVVEVAPAKVALTDVARRTRRSAEERTALVDHAFAIYEGRWPVLAVTLCCVLLGLAYLMVAAPIYRANILLQVEENRRSLAGLEELSRALGESAPPGETEVEVLRSRMLMGAVVDELGLDLSVVPVRFPLLGGAVARHHKGKAPAEAPLGLSGYAWGGERIRVGRVDVSDDLLDVPLTLTALGENRFRVAAPDGGVTVEGEVGKLAKVERDGQRLEVFVTDLAARADTRFEVIRRRTIDAIEHLQRNIRVEERGRATGILMVSLDGPDPKRIASVLDSIANTYVRQNVQRKSAETAKTLEFVETQLPAIKTALDQAQSDLNRFQISHGTVDLTAETQSVLQRSVEIERAMTELDMQRSELRQKFTENHPSIASIKEKYEQLRSERGALAGRMRALPATEVDAAKHHRDVKVASELYSLLLNKAQELRLVKSGTVGDVRILDTAAVPHRPLSPKPIFALGFSTMLGLALGVGGVLVRKTMAKGADDPEEIENELGLPVYALVPRSGRQVDLSGAASADRRPAILAAIDSGDAAVENLRSLRTSLQFALVESRNNVVAINGPTPGVGKTFIAVNLAWVLASAERRVLLIDADLRRGRLHRYFAEARQPGLSDVISGSTGIDAAIRRTTHPGLDILSTGQVPPNPSELLASQRFQQLLGELARRYDLVVVDTPPVLAVTDATLVGRLAGVNLLVLRAGEHPVREISLALKRLTQNGINVQGAVLNDAKMSTGRFGKYGRYQKYEYRSVDQA